MGVFDTQLLIGGGSNGWAKKSGRIGLKNRNPKATAVSARIHARSQRSK
jgi:hypothetical protein